MSIIAPAILVENTDQYKERIEQVQSFAERLHIDISDGEFAPTFTVDTKDVFWPENVKADLHAMVARPSEHVDAMIEKKPHMIIFHAEVEEDLIPVIQKVKGHDIKAGLALQRPSVPTELRELIELVDHVMIFSGDLGHHGGTASMMQLEKVRLIKAIRSNVEIGWDGGVTMENVYTLSQGGVDVLNVGGAIAKAHDQAEAYNQLVNEVNKHGVI